MYYSAFLCQVRYCLTPTFLLKSDGHGGLNCKQVMQRARRHSWTHREHSLYYLIIGALNNQAQETAASGGEQGIL